MTTHLKFDNSKTGFKRVSEYLKSNKIKTTNCIIFMEATGHYHLNLFYYLHDKGFKVSVINPALTRSVSYAGLGILDNESGNKYKRKRISKNGNENIRNAIYIAAQVCATTHLDPYFDAKLAEYKQCMSHKEAVVVLSRKMLRIAFHL